MKTKGRDDLAPFFVGAFPSVPSAKGHPRLWDMDRPSGNPTKRYARGATFLGRKPPQLSSDEFIRPIAKVAFL